MKRIYQQLIALLTSLIAPQIVQANPSSGKNDLRDQIQVVELYTEKSADPLNRIIASQLKESLAKEYNIMNTRVSIKPLPSDSSSWIKIEPPKLTMTGYVDNTIKEIKIGDVEFFENPHGEVYMKLPNEMQLFYLRTPIKSSGLAKDSTSLQSSHPKEIEDKSLEDLTKLDINSVYILLFLFLVILVGELARNLASHIVPKKDGQKDKILVANLTNPSRPDLSVEELRSFLVSAQNRASEDLRTYKGLEKPRDSYSYEMDLTRVLDNLKSSLQYLSVHKISKRMCKKVVLALQKEIEHDPKLKKRFSKDIITVSRLGKICEKVNESLFPSTDRLHGIKFSN